MSLVGYRPNKKAAVKEYRPSKKAQSHGSIIEDLHHCVVSS